jgi:serine/threonine protein kinase
MATTEEDKAFNQFYNDVINELKQDDQWENFSSLYRNNGRRDAILECYYMKLPDKMVVLIEKGEWFTKAKAHQSNNNTAQAAVPQRRNRYLMYSVSQTSKQPAKRKTYRDNVVLEQNFDGAFVAHKIYVEFVKASHQMVEIIETRCFNKDNGMMEQTNDVPVPVPVPEPVLVTANNNNNNTTWESKINMVKTFADDIFHHPADSMNCDALNLEKVQSMLLTGLIQFAIVQEWDSRKKDGCTLRCPIQVTHQGEIYITVKETDTTNFEISTENRKRLYASVKEDESMEDNANEANGLLKKDKVHQIIDVLIWFPTKNLELGNCILSDVEYKASNADKVARIAQGDMYTTNILQAHRVPCILVDIVGGEDWNEWKITATAIVPNDGIFVDDSIPQWCKSQLYTGQGADGLCGLADGLVSAYESYPTKKDDLGLLLGPVVGKNGCKVAKAYINAKYRQPNLHLVKEFTDEYANLYSTANKKIQLLEMNYVEDDWSKDITSSTFIDILTTLLKLHNNGIVHGDIRLANMLSTGVLIDFDLAGEHDKATYPHGYQSIKRDGMRHNEIIEAIANGTVTSVTLKTMHDCYSMAFVMRLFEARECWTSITNVVQNGKIQEAIDMLQNTKRMEVKLTNTTIRSLFGTGGTTTKPLEM